MSRLSEQMLVFFVIVLIGRLFSACSQTSLFHAHIIPSTVDTLICVTSLTDIATYLTAVILISEFNVSLCTHC